MWTPSRHVLLLLVVACVVGALGWWWWVQRQQRAAELEAQHYVSVVIPAMRRLRARGRETCEVEARGATVDVSLLQLLDDLASTVNDANVWHRLYIMATIYKRGQYPVYRPDDTTADNCCRTILLHAPRHAMDIRAHAAALMYADPIGAEDRAGQDLPTHVADRLIAQAMRASATHHRDTHQDTQRREPRILRPVDPPIVPDDHQNAHDHGVVASARRIIQELPQGSSVDDAAVESAIAGEDVSDDTKAAAIVAYDSLRRDIDSPAFGISEKDAFDRVWRATTNRDSIVHGLASMVEHGQPVCHTGKMSRIAAMLDDPSSKGPSKGVQPVWAHKEIMSAKAAAIRDEVLARHDEGARRAYEQGSGPSLEEDMAQEFESWARRYVKDHGLSDHVMTPIIESIQAGF
jgi:hypothetical protein